MFSKSRIRLVFVKLPTNVLLSFRVYLHIFPEHVLALYFRQVGVHFANFMPNLSISEVSL